MTDMENPLTWGLNKAEWDKRWPSKWKCNSYTKAICINNKISIHNFPGDCGALTINGAYRADKETLDLLEDIASSNGFSKIFATLVGDNSHGYYDKAIKAFKKNRWILVKKGISNRKLDNDVIDYVYVKYISNCKFKGYYGGN